MATPSVRARLFPAILISTLGAGACEQYQRFGRDGDSYGPVDPINFPPANLGARGDRMRPGIGTFTQAKAFIASNRTGYFGYPVPPAMLAGAAANPVLLTIDGRPNPRLPTTTAYSFEPNCQAPPGYRYTDWRKQQEGIRYDQQGTIFPTLPRATYTPGVEVSSTYVPVVNEVAASAAGRPCQQLKSEEELKKAMLIGKPTGRLMAWLIIDPAAGVYRWNESSANAGGDELQKWGWYNRYLLAYLDGGEILTEPKTVTEMVMGMPVERAQVLMKTQRLFYPRSPVTATVTRPADGMRVLGTPAPGRLGGGTDVLQAARGEEGYSPVCQVFTYDMGGPAVPQDDMPPDGYMGLRLPDSVAAIEAMFGTPEMPLIMERRLLPGSPPYVYCLQVEGQ